MMIKTGPTYIKGENGFTLIEIISVLVILGIFAAVAMPRFMDLQEDGRQTVAQTAIAETQSRLSMAYGKYLLTHGEEPKNIGRLCNRKYGLNDNSILKPLHESFILSHIPNLDIVLDFYLLPQ